MIQKNLLFALIVMFGISAHSQNLVGIAEQKVPAKVLATFQSKFPAASGVTWQESMEVYFLPKFMDGSSEKQALIDAKGNCAEVLTKINSTALPAAAATYVNTNYAGKLINYTAQIVYANASNPVRYEVKVGGKDLIFDANGAFINESNNVFK